MQPSGCSFCRSGPALPSASRPGLQTGFFFCRVVDGPPKVHLYLLWSQSCPHCLEARPQVQALLADQTWVELHDLALEHSGNVERYVTMARALGLMLGAVGLTALVARGSRQT